MCLESASVNGGNNFQDFLHFFYLDNGKDGSEFEEYTAAQKKIIFLIKICNKRPKMGLNRSPDIHCSSVQCNMVVSAYEIHRHLQPYCTELTCCTFMQSSCYGNPTCIMIGPFLLNFISSFYQFRISALISAF